MLQSSLNLLVVFSLFQTTSRVGLKPSNAGLWEYEAACFLCILPQAQLSSGLQHVKGRVSEENRIPWSGYCWKAMRAVVSCSVRKWDIMQTVWIYYVNNCVNNCVFALYTFSTGLLSLGLCFETLSCTQMGWQLTPVQDFWTSFCSYSLQWFDMLCSILYFQGITPEVRLHPCRRKASLGEWGHAGSCPVIILLDQKSCRKVSLFCKR